MKTLIYFSRATRPMSESDLQALLKQARAHNSSHDITGLLLYQDGYFLQALEGGEEEVDRLFERIGKDVRHTDLQKLYDHPATERGFGDWSMGFYLVEGHELAEHTGYSPVLKDNFDPRKLDLGDEMTFNLVSLFKQYVKDENAC